MPMFQVGVGRKTTEYLDIVVEADDREAAITLAKEAAETSLDMTSWQPGDCDYFETTVEDAAADADIGVVVDPEENPVSLFWNKDEDLNAFIDREMTGHNPPQIVLSDKNALVIANGDRDTFIQITDAGDQFAVALTNEAMNLIDPDGALVLQSLHGTVKEAFSAACQILNLEFDVADAPAP